MPTTTGLTEKQSAFVVAFVGTNGSAIESARQAGYTDAEHEHARLLKLPHVQAAIRTAFGERIQCRSAGMAMAVIDEALKAGSDWPKHLRLDAAKFVLKAGGYEANASLPQADKPLSEMSVTELEEFVSRGHAALDAIKPAIAEVIDIPALPS